MEYFHYPGWGKDTSLHLCQLFTNFNSKLFGIRVFSICVMAHSLYKWQKEKENENRVYVYHLDFKVSHRTLKTKQKIMSITSLLNKLHLCQNEQEIIKCCNNNKSHRDTPHDQPEECLILFPGDAGMSP